MNQPGLETMNRVPIWSRHYSETPMRSACFITRMEIFYRVWKDEGELAGKLASQQCLALPLNWIDLSDELLRRAAEIKALNALSLTDAYIAAAAVGHDAVLVHKDQEFKTLALDQKVLPLRN